jgi:putative DNA primase/helicase
MLDKAGAERTRKSIDEAQEFAPEPPSPLMRELPPADTFPIDSLGDLLAPAAIAIHDRVQAPLAICGQSVLAAATLAVQGHADVKLPTDHVKPLTNFYMSIAATGEGQVPSGGVGR